MSAALRQLKSPAAVEAAMQEFANLGRTEFLERYGYGKSLDYMVLDPRTGQWCDSKAIAGVAYGFQFPNKGPLRADEFSGGQATVVPALHALGFQVMKVGEDWSDQEVAATVQSYFTMFALDAAGAPYKKTDFNTALRQLLRGRSKASVELKFQNVSAVLHALDLPYIPGYKPRANVQLRLRKAVVDYLRRQSDSVAAIVDTLQAVQTGEQQVFKAVLVDPPPLQEIALVDRRARERVPRKIDYSAREESNRKLGRLGEHWAIEFEHRRLHEQGMPELFDRLDWVSDRLGDGTRYDILSFEADDQHRYIEVKTTNGPIATPFIISRNELEFSKEVEDAFFLYRLFDFRNSPAMFMLRGDISKRLHLEPTDYRASFRRVLA